MLCSTSRADFILRLRFFSEFPSYWKLGHWAAPVSFVVREERFADLDLEADRE